MQMVKIVTQLYTCPAFITDATPPMIDKMGCIVNTNFPLPLGYFSQCFCKQKKRWERSRWAMVLFQDCLEASSAMDSTDMTNNFFLLWMVGIWCCASTVSDKLFKVWLQLLRRWSCAQGNLLCTVQISAPMSKSRIWFIYQSTSLMFIKTFTPPKLAINSVFSYILPLGQTYCDGLGIKCDQLLHVLEKELSLRSCEHQHIYE